MASAIIVRLKGLPLSARAADVRAFFAGLRIPEGGVHIVGGPEGDCFIAFSSDEDARQAFTKDRQQIHGVEVRLFFSSRNEMNEIIGKARAGLAEPPPASHAPPPRAHSPVYQRGGYEPAYARNPTQNKYQEQHATAPASNGYEARWDGDTGSDASRTPVHHYRQDTVPPSQVAPLPQRFQTSQNTIQKHNYQQDDFGSFHLASNVNSTASRSTHPSGYTNGSYSPQDTAPAYTSHASAPSVQHQPHIPPSTQSYAATSGHLPSDEDYPTHADYPPHTSHSQPLLGRSPSLPGGYHQTGPQHETRTDYSSAPAPTLTGESWKRPEHDVSQAKAAAPGSGTLQWPPGFKPPHLGAKPLVASGHSNRAPSLGVSAHAPPPTIVSKATGATLAPPPVGPQYLELSRLPSEMLRPSVLESFLNPSVPLKLSSVKVVYDTHGLHLYSLVRFESYKDMQNVLARDGEQGIKIRKCSEDAFNRAVDGIPITAVPVHPPPRHQERSRESTRTDRDRERRKSRERERRRSGSPRRRRDERRRSPLSRQDRRGGRRSRSRSPRRVRSPIRKPPRKPDDPNRFMLQLNNVPYKAKDYEVKEFLNAPLKFAKRTALPDGNASDRWVCEFETKDNREKAIVNAEDKRIFQGRTMRCKVIGSAEADEYLAIPDRFGEKRKLENEVVILMEQGLVEPLIDPSKFGAFSTPMYVHGKNDVLTNTTNHPDGSASRQNGPLMGLNIPRGPNGELLPPPNMNLQGPHARGTSGSLSAPYDGGHIKTAHQMGREDDNSGHHGRGTYAGSHGRGGAYGSRDQNLRGRGGTKGVRGGFAGTGGSMRGLHPNESSDGYHMFFQNTPRGPRNGPTVLGGRSVSSTRPSLLAQPDSHSSPMILQHNTLMNSGQNSPNSSSPTIAVLSNIPKHATPQDVCQFLEIPTSMINCMRKAGDGTIFMDCGDPEKAISLMRKSRCDWKGSTITIRLIPMSKVDEEMAKRTAPEVDVDKEEAARLGEDGTVIACAGFPAKLDLEDVLHFFSGYAVKSDTVRIKMNSDGVPTGDCMLALENIEEASAAAQALHGKCLNGQIVSVVVV